jgi:succinoglycan biosynthesis transport protein ExoP
MQQQSLALDRYMEIIRRRKWLLIIPVALSIVAAAVAVTRLPSQQSEEYEAVSTVRLAVAGRASGSAISQGEAAIIANTANYVLQGDASLRAIASQLGLEMTPRRLRSMFRMDFVPNTEFIEIRARGDSPEAARDLANALANEWPRSSTEFYTALERPELARSFTVFQQASNGVLVPRTVSVESSAWLRVAAALAMGVVGGLGIVFVAEYTDRTLLSVYDVADASRSRVLGALPRVKRRRRRAIGSEMAHLREMRMLTVQLLHAVRAQRLRSLLFISIWPKDGTTSIASNAAASLAGDEFDVLLVDGNLENPALHSVFEAESRTPGLTDVLASGTQGNRLAVALSKAALTCDRPGLSLLMAGSPAADAWSTLGSTEMRQLVEFFNRDGHRDRPELLIIDGPPIASANALSLASAVGGVVVVCAEGSGTTDDVKRSVGQLKSLGANVVGVVYNKAQNAESVPVDWAEPASAYTTVPTPRHLADGDGDPRPPRS